MSNRRQPQGIPTGGQFAANDHDEATGSLGDYFEQRLGAIPTPEEIAERDAAEAAAEAKRNALYASAADASTYAFPNGGALAASAYDDVVNAGGDPKEIARIRENSAEQVARALHLGNDPERAEGFLRLAGWASSKLDEGTGANRNLESLQENIRTRGFQIESRAEIAERDAIRERGGLPEMAARARDFAEDVKDGVSGFRVSEFDGDEALPPAPRPKWLNRLMGGGR